MFNVGDRVKCVDNIGAAHVGLVNGGVYTVERTDYDSEYPIHLLGICHTSGVGFWEYRFTLFEKAPATPKVPQELSDWLIKGNIAPSPQFAKMLKEVYGVAVEVKTILIPTLVPAA